MADKPEVRARRYRLMWNDVKYEPGELKVVAYGADGKKVGETSIHTAGKAAAVALKADKTVLAADGEDLAYVTVSLVDKDGNELPTASDNISVEVSGAASFRGICNGDATWCSHSQGCRQEQQECEACKRGDSSEVNKTASPPNCLTPNPSPKERGVIRLFPYTKQPTDFRFIA